MNTSIKISSSAVDVAPGTAKGEVVKLVQGALLIAVAAYIASVAAPFCVWKGEVVLFSNDSFHTAYSVPAIAEYASAAPGSDWMSWLVAALIAAYPAYHAVWRVREGFGLSCEAPVFNKCVSRFLAAVSACLLLSMLFMGYGTVWLVNGSAMGDQSLVEAGHRAWNVSILMMLGCALMSLFKWFVAKGPGRNFGSGFAIELVRLSDVLLKRASSNLVLCYVAELLACVLALVFIAVAYVAVSVAIALVFTAVALVACLAGLPFLLAGMSHRWRGRVTPNCLRSPRPVPLRGWRLGMALPRSDNKWPRGDRAGSCRSVRKTCKNRKFLSHDEKNLQVFADHYSPFPFLKRHGCRRLNRPA